MRLVAELLLRVERCLLTMISNLTKGLIKAELGIPGHSSKGCNCERRRSYRQLCLGGICRSRRVSAETATAADGHSDVWRPSGALWGCRTTLLGWDTAESLCRLNQG